MRTHSGRLRVSLLLPGLIAVAAAIAAVGGIVGRTANGHAASVGSATIAVSAPAPSQPLNSPFQVQTSLTTFTPGISSTWGGYDFELAYDNAVLHVDSDDRGLCSAAGWGMIATSPHLVTVCAFQSSTDTGVLETATFECVADGSSTLTLVPRNDPTATQVGTALYDENGNDFVMTLQNASVTCGAAPTNTPTLAPTNTSTNTPTATRTPVPTSTHTNTPVVTNTPTSTPTPTFTATPRPTYTPVTGPVDLRGEWSHYSRCPVDDPAMLAVDGRSTIGFCVASASGSGSFKLGNTEAQAGASDIQFGLAGPNPFDVVSPSGGAIASAPVDVPGGLLGLMCPSTNPVVLAVCNLITDNSLNEVTATVEDAGPPTDFNFTAGTELGVPLMTLPIKVHLENPLLGDTCYVGTDADPIILRPATIDLTGSTLDVVRVKPDGTLATNHDLSDGDLSEVKLTGGTQADTTFAVPGATGCGANGVLDTAINQKTGLPSPSGNNSVVLSDGSSFIITFINQPSHYPYAGLDLENDWHAAVCDGPCVAPTPTPSPTATATPTPIQTIVPAGCNGNDTDCDGCPDLSEPPRTDPADPWDFYSVPVPALFAAPSPTSTFKDNVVAAADAQAVFAYVKVGARVGSSQYEADLNGNGTKDGIEYDRSVEGPGHSGAPDGVVSASDAQAAYAQAKMGYRC